MHKLIRLDEIYNVAVVYTNQVQAQPDNLFGGFDSIRTAGGNMMAHASTYRIFLRKAGTSMMVRELKRYIGSCNFLVNTPSKRVPSTLTYEKYTSHIFEKHKANFLPKIL